MKPTLISRMPISIVLIVLGYWLVVPGALQAQEPCRPAPVVAATAHTSQFEWRAYGADGASSKYAPIDQIHLDNFQSLEVAWRWCSPDAEVRRARPSLWPHHYEATPLMVGGVLYTSTSLSQAAAIDPVTGETLWIFDPQSYLYGSPPNLEFVHRGVAYWADGGDRRVVYATGSAHLYALDAGSGTPVPGFNGGAPIDLTEGLRRPVSRRLYGVSSPPTICRDVVVVGASILDFPAEDPMPPGDVRGYDVRTGALRWTFHTVPLGGEPGSESWVDGAEANGGGANVWAPMSCDEERGLVYLPVGTASNDFYGGGRPGADLFSESLVALEAESGRRAWHFQMVHHGLWDYDLPAAPNLLTITVDGRRIDAVAQVTKQGFVFVFDRESGEPVWPIEEREVPTATAMGDGASATQPVPSKPAPFDRQGITVDDLIDFSPSLRNAAKEVFDRFDHGELFTPPTERGTLTAPGLGGGASWAGASVDPEGILYVPSITLPFVLPLERQSGGANVFVGRPYPVPRIFQSLMILKPPYGRVTAIDLNTGGHRWMSAVGRGPSNHASFSGLDLPQRLGWERRSFTLRTATMLVVAQEGASAYRSTSTDFNADTYTLANFDPALLAYDARTGELRARVALPGNATGAPMSYMVDGVQYIAVPIGGSGLPAELVGLRLRE